MRTGRRTLNNRCNVDALEIQVIGFGKGVWRHRFDPPGKEKSEREKVRRGGGRCLNSSPLLFWLDEIRGHEFGGRPVVEALTGLHA